MESALEGYWGPVTANMDYCESNYEHSHYIAEFFNVLSSFGFCLIGWLGLHFHAGAIEARFGLGFIFIFIVGLGSAAFHGTLTYHMQLLDQLPMLWTVSCMCYVVINNKYRKPLYGIWLPWLLFTLALGITLTVLLTRGRVSRLIFHCTFCTGAFYCLYQVYEDYKRCVDSSFRRLYTLGFRVSIAAITCWLADVHACHLVKALPIGNPHFHAAWHVLACLGFYILHLLTLSERAVLLEQGPELKWFLRIIPYLSLQPLPKWIHRHNFITYREGRVLPEPMTPVKSSQGEACTSWGSARGSADRRQGFPSAGDPYLTSKRLLSTTRGA